jgi:hypothetical protein
MGINKNFVVKNGLEVDENLIYADGVADRVGIGTTNPQSTLDVAGDGIFEGDLDVEGLVNFSNTQQSTSTTTGSLVVGGGIGLDGNLNASGSASIGNDLTVANDATVASNISVGNSVTVGSDIFVQNNAVVEGSLEVSTTGLFGGSVSALEYFGDGINLAGIVTQIVPGIGVQIDASQDPGKGIVTVDAYKPTGKTIFVTQNGDDTNTGLSENHSKRTIKAAAQIANFGDTIKVYPGVYVEENPIVLKKTVSVEGTELRNCVVTPRFPDLDLFYVNNGCHITDMSFIGPEMTNGSAIVSFEPLEGVQVDRFFDGARMIRLNLDYIAKESVGFLTSGFSGFAGNHREQDAARLIDLNLDYIASETIGFLTSTDYKSPAFVVPTVPGDCEDDIKDILRSISYDLKAGSNKKSVGAGLSYYDNAGALQHITGTDVNGYSVRQATIDAIEHAVGIVTFVINNESYPDQYTSLTQDISSYSPILVPGGCGDTIVRIETLAGIVTSIVGLGTEQAPSIEFGVTLESQDCADDVKDIWRAICFDITRGGNFRCVRAGEIYYDEDWNLIPQILKNPGEVEQTIATLDYSFNVARSVVNNCTWGGYPVGVATDVIFADYDNVTGVATITAENHNLNQNDAVKIVGLGFTCPSDGGVLTLTYPTGAYGYVFNVLDVIDSDSFEVVVGQSTLPHTYVSGGTVQKYTSFQNEFYQVKDLGMQPDFETGFNNAINGCSNVVSAIRSCVGVVTTIVGLGSESGITTSYPGNSGIGFTGKIQITDAPYDEQTGEITIIPASPLNVKKGDIIEVRDLLYTYLLDTPVIKSYTTDQLGYDYYVDRMNEDNSIVINIGISTIARQYVSGTGYVVNRSVSVDNAIYDHTSGITTITAPGAYVRVGDVVTLRDLEFSCTSGAGTTTIYPTGNEGYKFRVTDVIGAGTTFVVKVGPSTIPHTYVDGGYVKPPYSPGVGPITQGPYVRNCTNFVPGSIGMKVNGFEAEPGDQIDIGVTGSMSVDSYTQYNQGGIGVSITNGAYSQLVSIFTICNDIAIFTGSGGQCDITNSNSSFGRLGLVADGVGDNTSKSIYRYTGVVEQNAAVEQDTVIISGIGSYRPYDGQALYFGELFYIVQTIEVDNPGGGYSDLNPPLVTIDAPPPDAFGIRAEASPNVVNGKVVSIDVIATGSQYRTAPSITIAPPPPGPNAVQATAQATVYPTYYTIESATLPSAGVSTVVLQQNLNNTVSAGTTVYFSRLSLQITSSHSFEWVGTGNNINTAKPALGGVLIPENEVVKLNGGEVVYTSTDQAGNFKIGDDIVINQITGTISGRAFSQSLLNTVTPLILGISK